MKTYEKTKPAYSEIEVQSQGLRDLLRSVIGDYPGQSFDGTSVYIPGPFQAVVHYWEELRAEIEPKEGDSEETKQAREDLNEMMNSIRASTELESYFKTRESNMESGVITYEFLWTIFRPKTKVFARPFLNIPQIFEVPYSPDPYERRRVSIPCWCYDYNGKSQVKTFYEFDIEHFRGTKDISSLFCYPINYLKEEDGQLEELQERLRKRGEKFIELCTVEKGSKQMSEYNDIVLLASGSLSRSLVQDGDDNRTLRSSQEDEFSEQNIPATPKEDNNVKTVAVKGKFIVDAGAFLQHGSRYGSYPLGKYTSVDVEDPNEKPDSYDVVSIEQERDKFLLCPPRVLGYSTQQKIWGQFKVDAVRRVEPVKIKTAFDTDLQLHQEYKDMIKALVENHTKTNDSKTDRKDMDVIEGKGRGLVILLHGPPGVGKTLTAETIAEATGKPLLVVSVAEIGLNASKAENNLERMFHLAGAWEAILLVDEADVFLESRMSTGDPNRNALVSVLLRVLEYYEGIMILTTNRITSLDIAVQSRIHLAIRYEDLTKAQKRQVFSSFLNKLQDKDKSIISPSNRANIDDWVEEIGSEQKLNGRQIRNLVNSAHALACSNGQGGSLRKDHFKKVLSITREFQEQLEGLTRDRRADNEVDRRTR
ncbi:uncharacterized protein N7458_011526 [Penicillium daleae]|uniref:AAA+ ATPase domain-containing protein n=1 Tax=Penicillium daleae TaxID=63821 RepID=A0AAD6BUW8_9EURO|nr:uncharacterized protein N7458_011526 [Penicillium daleae]KAJ5432370.1 hypothetical protein N7458_011526 [Penicillium daleae]